MGAYGERYLLPKSKGMGIMASEFKLREFVFSMESTTEDLEKLNRMRAQDVHYFDCVAAQDVNEHTKNKYLTESPFMRMLEYGANKDKYWIGNDMIFKFEDCIDFLRVLYGGRYDFSPLF